MDVQLQVQRIGVAVAPALAETQEGGATEAEVVIFRAGFQHAHPVNQDVRERFSSHGARGCCAAACSSSAHSFSLMSFRP